MPAPDPADVAATLARKAAGDEAAVEVIGDDTSVPDDVVGFHAQQAVEKRIKSALAGRSVAYPRTHNLAYLIDLLGKEGLPPPERVEELEALTPWAATFRYEDVPEATIDRKHVRDLVASVRSWAEGVAQAD